MRKQPSTLSPSHSGAVLINYYGEHSKMWVRPEDIELPPADESEHLRQLKQVGRQQNK